MKAFICILALATAVNAGLLHHAPAPLALPLSHGGASLHHGGAQLIHVQDGGLGGLGGGLAYGGGLGGGLALGSSLGGGHLAAPLLAPAPLPLHQSTQLIRVIHQQAPILAPAPTHLKVIRVINEAPLIHHAPAPLKIVKVLHQAPQLHHIPTGW